MMASAMEVLSEIELSQREFTAFQKLIFELAGISLAPGKQVLVRSRLTRRLRKLHLNSFSSYLDLLSDPASTEREAFINCLTTNKTEFFREPHHFQFLREQVIAEAKDLARNTGERKLRLWCAAGSSGEEPYSLAITLREAFPTGSGWDLRILATDIDTDVLQTAAAGRYPEATLQTLPERYRDKYFHIRHDGSGQVRDELRELITFRRLNLNQSEWPIRTAFDAIFCRNVMIYFDQPTQKRLVEHMTELLRPGGYLMIGHSESLMGFPGRLESLGQTIYRLPTSAFRDKAADTRAPQTKSNTFPPTCAVAKPTIATFDKPRSGGTSSQSDSVAEALGSILPDAKVIDRHRTAAGLTGDHSSDANKYLIVGEYYASAIPCIIGTTLGSCIAACLQDPSTNICGMNHFMLPERRLEPTISASYGVHAMEMLINAMMKLGANRQKLRAKIFGGANVINCTTETGNVGDCNATFVKRFLDTERIPLDAEYIGGNRGMRIALDTATFKVKVKLLDNKQAEALLQQQAMASRVCSDSLTKQTASSITLF